MVSVMAVRNSESGGIEEFSGGGGGGESRRVSRRE